MGNNRFFLPQAALDAWLDEGRILLEGDTMTLQPHGMRMRLTSAVRFLEEVAGGGDVPGLIGKVKDMEQLAALSGEHCADSVIVGDDAYQVVEGFVGEPLPQQASEPPTTPAPEPAGEEDLLGLLARLLEPR